MRNLHRLLLAISLIAATLIFSAIETRTLAANIHAAAVTALSFSFFPHTTNVTPNSPPVAVNDSYTIHDRMIPLNPSALSNDFDPDGNPITICQVVTSPQHGSLSHNGQNFSFTAHAGYVGPDSFTYKICDNAFGSSQPATVSLNIVNQNPVAVPDEYEIVGLTDLGSLLANDYDPDGDPLTGIVYYTGPAYPFPAHGNIQRYESVPGSNRYDSVRFNPTAGYSGSDSFTYKVCDSLNACSPPTTVSLYIIDDGLNNGAVSCNARVGLPVNVTNGNVYLHQNDYQLPGLVSASTLLVLTTVIPAASDSLAADGPRPTTNRWSASTAACCVISSPTGRLSILAGLSVRRDRLSRCWVISMALWLQTGTASH